MLHFVSGVLYWLFSGFADARPADWLIYNLVVVGATLKWSMTPFISFIASVFIIRFHCIWYTSWIVSCASSHGLCDYIARSTFVISMSKLNNSYRLGITVSRLKRFRSMFKALSMAIEAVRVRPVNRFGCRSIYGSTQQLTRLNIEHTKDAFEKHRFVV